MEDGTSTIPQMAPEIPPWYPRRTRGKGIVGGGASTPHYGTPISRNGTHDAPMEIGSVWGTLDAPIWHLRDTGEWDVGAPPPTVETVHGGMGRP